MQYTFFDNSRLNGFRRCPLYYALRYKLHWEREIDGVPGTAFGTCWHAGMERMLSHLRESLNRPKRSELADILFEGFNDEWESLDLPTQDQITMDPAILKMVGIRSPITAKEMVFTFLELNYDWLQSIDILDIERPFLVPLLPDEKIMYIGRWDCVYQDRQGVWDWEHKTTSLYAKDYGFQLKFISGFSPNTQVDGYSFAGHLIYGDKFKGTVINGSLVHKHVYELHTGTYKYAKGIKTPTHKQLPFIRSMDDLRTWHTEACYWTLSVRKHDEDLFYPRNCEGCSTPYGNCTFRGICSMTSDPLHRLKALPAGFSVSPWEPYSQEILEKLLEEYKNPTK